jgi:hypothetical protein
MENVDTVLLGLLAIAFAIIMHAKILGKELNMALNRDALDRGLQAVADGLSALAAAIANPPANLAEAQAALDDTGTKLEAFAAQLGELKTAEDAEDAG